MASKYIFECDGCGAAAEGKEKETPKGWRCFYVSVYSKGKTEVFNVKSNLIHTYPKCERMAPAITANVTRHLWTAT